MAFRAHYWSCGKFAQFIRRNTGQTMHPIAASFEEWHQIREYNKKAAPFFFWFTEEFLNNVQNILHGPMDLIDSIRSYVLNRYVDKIHYLPTRLEPGKYFDVDTRLLNGMFETLVDFVETEKAWMDIVFDPDVKKPHRIFRWTRFRSAQHGLNHLNWEISLAEPQLDKWGNDTSSPLQAAAAQEILDLYVWWTIKRPLRQDPYDESGSTAEHEKLAKTHGSNWIGLSRKDRDMTGYDSSLEKLRVIEKRNEDEDEEMMIRLIKVRQSLWT
jgi:hypothetical protein